MAKSHEGKLALVTGATRGLGRAIAERLRDDGAKVIATGTSPGGKPPEGCEYMAVDFTDAKAAEAFAEKMNQRAHELGADSSHFVNPHGLHDPHHFTTARDLAIIARAASELGWREFYADVLLHHPETSWRNLNPRMDAMPVDTDAAARARFERWASGSTGYPVIDAAMRQLRSTGWMHNRLRMLVASFLVKALHLPWQWGARHFMEHLLDGDVASNSHGWQWTAGTGTDAAPYFRVFNPTTQALRFDPDGEFVRRWVPELASLPGAAIHEPGVRRPDGYPSPMVDHGAERDEALRRYRLVTAGSR